MELITAISAITAPASRPLHSVQATRESEQRAAGDLPPHTLMQRAGLATARLALALAPHARRIWIACGPGNNGGDGFEAAMLLQQAGKAVILTWTGVDAGKNFPPDAQASMQRALAAGLGIATEAPSQFDFCIDALLGIGINGSRFAKQASPASQKLAQWLTMIRNCGAPVLAIDVPSGLDADTGTDLAALLSKENSAPGAIVHRARSSQHPAAGPRFTLSLLTLKPGLFTAAGRDLAGEVWLDKLCDERSGDNQELVAATAFLPGLDSTTQRRRPAAAHASHKGSFGDVAVIGGQSTTAGSMAGAALLAARGALQAGAGRVMVSLLGEPPIHVDMTQPELMFRHLDALDLSRQVAVCGCGGGQQIAKVLPRVLSTAAKAVFDADALNAVAADTGLAQQLLARQGRGYQTVLTPHPLEAARLLSCTVAEVQADRLDAASRLAERFQCTVVLKGAGTVIATPDRLPLINPTGNALLATAGTGDVLAGMIGAGLAGGSSPEEAARDAVFAHGRMADLWAIHHPDKPFTASSLAGSATPA